MGYSCNCFLLFDDFNYFFSFLLLTPNAGNIRSRLSYSTFSLSVYSLVFNFFTQSCYLPQIVITIFFLIKGLIEVSANSFSIFDYFARKLASFLASKRII